MEEQIHITPVIAIVGRTNVGKSTLFNRFLEQKKAIVSAVPGTTQDINFGHCDWQNKTLTIIDTAGLDLTAKKATEENLKRQAMLAMHKADLILFLVDVAEGLNPQDRALANFLQKSQKSAKDGSASGGKILLVANKADSPSRRALVENAEWLKLGYGTPIPVSATNGSGVGDLLDQVIATLQIENKETSERPLIDIRVAIIGKPNVGKSSLLNALAGEERVIVSAVPHTTKEPQDTFLSYEMPDGNKKNLLLIDTVGIRKKAHVAPGIEKIGVIMSLEELKRADVIFLIIDVEEGVGVQEKKLAGFIEDHSVSVVVVVNKWDLSTTKNLGTAEDYKDYVHLQLPFYAWAPVTFISAKTGHRVNKLLDTAIAVAHERERVLHQEEIDAFVETLKKQHHAVFARGENRPKVYGITQIGVKPPTFMVVVKDKETLHPSFLRFIENRIREKFGFEGTPIRVLAREIGE